MAKAKKKNPSQLSERFLKNITEPTVCTDGSGRYGLQCNVTRSASGDLKFYFRQKLLFEGTRITVGIGTYTQTVRIGTDTSISLKEARDIAHENHKKARAGIDPRKSIKIKIQGVLTFNEVVEIFIPERSKEMKWKTGGGAERSWRGEIRRHAQPAFGHLPVDQVTSERIGGVLNPLFTTLPPTAKRLCCYLRLIFEWCVEEGYCKDNPVSDKVSRKGKKSQHITKHYKFLPYHKICVAIKALEDSGASLATKLAQELQIFTAARHNSVRNACWVEIDWENKLWTIPDEHMKMKKAHRVPLSSGALEVLERAFKLLRKADTDLIFPSPYSGGVLSQKTLPNLCRKLGLGGTPHGFRGSFATWCADKGVPQELTEAALAHTPAAIVRAYTHTDYLARRKRLMDAWSDEITGKLPADWKWLEGDAADSHEAYIESQRQFAEAQATIASMAATIASMAATMADMAADMALLKAS